MGAPSPELVDLWLARAFNAQDVDAGAAMYHPDASVVRLDQVHGTGAVVRGEAASTERIADALLVTAKSAGAALVAGAGAKYAKGVSHA
jgi:hypothetical protein